MRHGIGAGGSGWWDERVTAAEAQRHMAKRSGQQPETYIKHASATTCASEVVGTTFTIPGPPVAKQRPRRGKAGNWYTPKQTTDYEEQVAKCAMVAGLKLEPDKHYRLQITFYLSTHRKDIDNCVKSVLDGLQRTGDDWNDSQVMSLVARKINVPRGDEEATVVSVDVIRGE